MTYINDLPRIKDALDRAVDALDTLANSISIPEAEAVRTISSRLWAVLHGESWQGSEEAIKPWVDVTKKEAV